MGDIDFLTGLNNMAICEQYDLDYFDKVLSMIKEYYQASDVMLVSTFSDRMSDEMFGSEKIIKADDCVINISEDASKKLLIRNNSKNIEYSELLSSILNNMFKNKELIERLKNEKYTDSLLKTKNRYAYDELIEKKCTYNNLGVAFVDANGLGIVNNMYGYPKGDELLKTVTKSLTDNFRTTDVYRIGGDEFVVICQNVDKSLFLDKIANSQVYLDTTEYSASYGIVYCTTTNNLKEVVEDASIKMKKNKEKHREEHPEEYLDKYKVKYKGVNV